MDPKYLLILVALFFIIVSAVCASFSLRYKEQFSEVSSNLIVNAKNYLYNKNGLIYFYSYGAGNNAITSTLESSPATNTKVNQVLSFSFNFIDKYCHSLPTNDNQRCHNIFIDYYTTVDPYTNVFEKERGAKTTNTMVSANESQSRVRVLNNYYQFYKRGFIFDNIHQIDIVDESMSSTSPSTMYILHVSGEGLAALALSRPLFISFGPYGLYGVRHSYPRSLFESFSSYHNEGNYLICLVPVNTVNAYQNFKLYPDSSSNIGNLFMQPGNDKIINKNYPATAYYLSFLKPLNMIGTNATINKLNTMTLVFSSDYLEKTLSINSSNTSTSKFATFSFIVTSQTSPEPNLRYINNIEFTYNVTADKIFQVKIIDSQGSISYYYPHNDFNDILKTYVRQNEKLTRKFHIVVCISMNCIIITAYVQTKHMETLMGDMCFITKSQLTPQNIELVLNYDPSEVEERLRNVPSSTYKAGTLAYEMNKYSSFLTLSCIPNFAYLGKSLGYYL